MKPKIEKKFYELLDFAKKHGLSELTWQEKGVRISFRRGLNDKPAPVQSAPEGKVVKEERCETICSPIVGTFRRSVSKNRPPLVMKGNHVKPGDRLGVVECMRIPTEVVSYCKGTIKDIFINDGQTVEYGQPLISVLLPRED